MRMFNSNPIYETSLQSSSGQVGQVQFEMFHLKGLEVIANTNHLWQMRLQQDKGKECMQGLYKTDMERWTRGQ